MKIRALTAPSARSGLSFSEMDVNPDGEHDVVIRVTHCGICHSDIHMIDNDWGMSNYPLVPGHEVVGIVEETGRAITHLRSGDRVGFGWQRGACLQCADCLGGNENLCDASQGTITHGYGGFASHLVADGRFAFPLPEGIPSVSAGPLLCAGITVYGGLRSAGMRGGQRIGVIGIGGLGHLAVAFARALGNEVVAFTTSEDKAKSAVDLGAHEAVVHRDGEFDRPPGKPCDIILSTAPASIATSAFVNLLASDGTLCFVGVPDKPLSIDLFPLLVKRRRIMASPIGGRSMITSMLRDADRFGVAPVVETFPMCKADEALEKVRSNRVRYRAVLVA